MKKRIILIFCYDGTHFSGWQKQTADVVTIQSVMELAVAKIAQHSVELIASGRTDRGVHALKQIAHFDTTAKREKSAWIYGVNRYLPKSIAIIDALEVPINFHARFDACSRYYRYVLSNNPIRPTLLRNKVGWTFVKLDVTLMNQAAQYLIGEQDFSSFRAAECQAKTPIKYMYRIDVYQSQGFICFDFEANGFLHHMVRNIVGALIYVGSNKINLAEFKLIIAAKSRHRAPPTFMPDGLYFLAPRYPQDYQLDFSLLPAWFWGKSIINA